MPNSNDEILTLLEKHLPAVNAQVIKSFEDRGFSWDSEESLDADVEEVYDTEVEECDWEVDEVTASAGWRAQSLKLTHSASRSITACRLI